MKVVRYIKSYFIFISAITLIACGGGGDGDEQPPVEQNDPPAKAIGVLPANGEPCSDYQEVLNDDSKVLVAFGWNSAQGAQSYILIVWEGTTEVFRNSFNGLSTEVQLDRGKTYTWSVTSTNSAGETAGDTYSFTTPGIPVGNFAPYAAEINVEFDTNTTEMTISWTGRDEDGDTLTYDINVEENGNLLAEEIDLSAESLDPIVFLNGANYTVEVISKDPSGSFSVSIVEIEAPQ